MSYSYIVLELCKTQFSSIYSLWFKDHFPLNLTITRRKIVDSSKLKEFANDNFKFDENGRKLSKRVENTVGRREIARTSNFSFSYSVFKRLVSQGRQKVSLCGNGLICFFMVFVKGNASMSSIPYFENHVRYFVQNRINLLTSISFKL